MFRSCCNHNQLKSLFKIQNGKQQKLQIDITHNKQHREPHQKGKYEVHQCGFDV